MRIQIGLAFIFIMQGGALLAQSCPATITLGGACGTKISTSVPTDWGVNPVITVSSDGGGGSYAGASQNWTSTNCGYTLNATLNLTNGVSSATCVYVSGVLVLPIELISFNASAENEKVLLEWQTASESNTDYFEVERSGSPFETIGKIKAAGNSSVTKKYTFADEKPKEGIAYYRLKEINLNGKFIYSNVIAVEYKSTTPQLFIYPDPASDGYIYFSIKTPIKENISFLLCNSIGKIVCSKTITPEQQGNTLMINSSALSLPSGFYLLIGHSEHYHFTQKIIANHE